jgi:hypothetical protein
LWNDKAIGEREDLLWGLLKLYTFTDLDIEDVLSPENSQLSPLDIRLSWQLSQALTARGAARYTEDDEDKADRPTLDFAAQLTNEGSWLDAVFVLLHLSSDEVGAKSIQNHLAHHAGKIGSEDSQSFNTLTQNFKIPASWIWEAKALYMRSELDHLTKPISHFLRRLHRTLSLSLIMILFGLCLEVFMARRTPYLSGISEEKSTRTFWNCSTQRREDGL